MNSSTDRPANGSQMALRTGTYITLFVLFLVTLSQSMDRYVLAILIEPIKNDLGASDTQMGLLSGIAFAFFYGTLAIPMARLADRTNRIRLLSAAVAIWSIFTMLSGFVANFTQMVITRIGVACGESVGAPASHSVVADSVPAQRRSGALAVLALGTAVGAMLANIVGGTANEYLSWRHAFVIAGAPGLLLALVLLLVVKEPPRGWSDGLALKQDQNLDLSTALKRLAKRKAYVHLIIGLSLAAISSYGAVSWLPAFFLRKFDVGTSELGQSLFLVQGIPLFVSTIAGGLLVDHL